MVITLEVDIQVQYFIIDNSRPVLRRRNVRWRETENRIGERAGQREGEKSIRNRVLRANCAEGPNRREEADWWKWRINLNNLRNRREKANWEYMLCVYMCVVCMKDRDLNGGERGGGKIENIRNENRVIEKKMTMRIHIERWS